MNLHKKNLYMGVEERVHKGEFKSKVWNRNPLIKGQTMNIMTSKAFKLSFVKKG